MKKKPEPPSRAPAWLLGGLCLAGLLFTLYWLNRGALTAPFERDEGEFAYSAWLLGHGGLPYRDAFLQKPPLIIYTYMLAGLLDPDATWPPRLLALLALLGAALLLRRVARHYYGETAGWASAWWLVTMASLPTVSPYAAYTEKFLLLPMLAAWAAYVSWEERPGPGKFLLAAFCASLAVAYKQIALPPLLLICCFWLYRAYRREGRSGAWRGGAMAFLGVAVAAVLSLGYFVWSGAGPKLWECAVRFNLHYSALMRGFSTGYMRAAARDWWPLLALGAVFLWRRPARWLLHSALLLSCAAFVLKAVTVHYYIPMIPFLCLPAAAGLASLLGPCASPRRAGLDAAAIAAVAILLCWPHRRLIAMSGERLFDSFYTGNPFVEAVPAAKRVAELAAPDDYVYVAGSEPEILYYAKRRSPTRFVIAYPFMLPTPLAASYQREIIADLERRPPKVVVYANSPLSWLASAK
ncbi:MAG: hypothetical protein PHF00_09340, partial [Elusimicrobia bacterium]|nr:hypothetical protein [Elusimicrobiota bacterium]